MTTHLPSFLDAVRLGVAAAAPRARAFARQVLVLERTGSTNDEVARAAMTGAPEGYGVIAAEQTSGRGRRGATWHSPPGAGLYLSTLLRPAQWPSILCRQGSGAQVRAGDPSPAASLVTLMAGVAVASALRDVGASGIELKWPNDVMVRGAYVRGSAVSWRKLAGILAEGASEAGVLRTVVLGIGINVCASDAPDEIAARKIALDELVASQPHEDVNLLHVRHLTTALLVRLCEGHDQLARGAFDEIVLRWRALAPSVDGTRIRWHDQGVPRLGRADGIDATGALRVRPDDGPTLVVHGGDVEWLIEGRDA